MPIRENSWLFFLRFSKTIQRALRADVQLAVSVRICGGGRSEESQESEPENDQLLHARCRWSSMTPAGSTRAAVSGNAGPASSVLDVRVVIRRYAKHIG